MHYDNTSEKTLLASCLGLVTVDESSIVRLVHFTLQEYFNRHSEHFQSPHSAMTEVCLTYLNFDSINKISYTLDSAPAETRFLQHASSYWGLYARNGLTAGVRSLALQLLGRFGGHISAKLLVWGNFDRRERRRRHSERFAGLHCAAYLGLHEIAIGLLEGGEGCSADMADTWGRTPLMWASESGHEEMVKLLLWRKDVNPNSRNDDGRTPLLCAAEGGHEGVVKLLLGWRGVNPNSKDHNGSSPLWYEGIVKLLLRRKKVNPNSRDTSGNTPLLYAAKGGHEGIVKLLLDQREINPDTGKNNGKTPLWCAAKGGHEGIVKLLLGRKEVNPDSRDNYHGRTPLSCAAEDGHQGIVELLLGQKKVNPDSRDHDDLTPLRWAT